MPPRLKIFDPDSTPAMPPKPTPNPPLRNPASGPPANSLPPAYELLLDLHQQHMDAIYAATKLFTDAVGTPK